MKYTKASMYGRNVLILKGSKFIGTYNSQIAVGQERVLVAMNRMILPNGT